MARESAGFRFILSIALLVATPEVFAGSTVANSADPLLAVDLNRSAIIADIVKGFEAQASEGATRLKLRLESLRADRLLAASLASSRESLDAILAEAESPHALAISQVRAKALGDPDRDLAYTPIVPCKIVDTFFSPIGRLPASSTTAFDANAADFTPQGGNNTCATTLPANMAAIAAQIAVVNPSNQGWVNLWPVGQPLPNNVTLGYYPDYAGNLPGITTGSAIVPLCIGSCAGGKEFNLNTAAEAAISISVVGYFTPAAIAGVNGGTVTSVSTGPGVTGGPFTTSGTIGLASTQLLPTAACSANQIPKWNGTAWSCGTDNAGTAGVTSVATGTGLTGGTITSSGTISIASGGVGTVQLADGAVTSSKLAIGSLPVAANFYFANNYAISAFGTGTFVSPSCPAGTAAISGSCLGSVFGLKISSSFPNVSNGWTCNYISDASISATVTAGVICLASPAAAK